MIPPKPHAAKYFPEKSSMLPACGPRPSVLLTDIALLSLVNLKAPIEGVGKTPIAIELENTE